MAASKPLPFKVIMSYLGDVTHLFGDRAVILIRNTDGDYLGAAGELRYDFEAQEITLHTTKYDERILEVPAGGAPWPIIAGTQQEQGRHAPRIASGCLDFRTRSGLSICQDPRCLACQTKPAPCLKTVCRCGQ